MKLEQVEEAGSSASSTRKRKAAAAAATPEGEAALKGFIGSTRHRHGVVMGVNVPLKNPVQ